MAKSKRKTKRPSALSTLTEREPIVWSVSAICIELRGFAHVLTALSSPLGVAATIRESKADGPPLGDMADADGLDDDAAELLFVERATKRLAKDIAEARRAAGKVALGQHAEAFNLVMHRLARHVAPMADGSAWSVSASFGLRPSAESYHKRYAEASDECRVGLIQLADLIEATGVRAHDEWLTVSEAAAVFAITKPQLSKLCDAGRVRFIGKGHDRHIDANSVAKYVLSRDKSVEPAESDGAVERLCDGANVDDAGW